MNYTGVECPVCKQKFNENDDVVVCPVCGTPHHRACYSRLGNCANESRHDGSFVFEMPKRKDEAPLFGFGASVSEDADKGSGLFGEGDTPDNEQPPFASQNGPFEFELDENTQVDGIPMEEVIQFVGRDSFSAKLTLNLALLDKFNRPRPNIAAFLLPYLWLFYRKLYKFGILVIALTLISTVAFTNRNTIDYTKRLYNAYMSAVRGEIPLDEFAEKVDQIQQQGTGNSIYFDAAPQVCSLIIRLVVALFANKWYLENMKKQVLKTREECSSMDQYMSALSVKGGKSLPAAIISFVAFGILNAAYQLLLVFI